MIVKEQDEVVGLQQHPSGQPCLNCTSIFFGSPNGGYWSVPVINFRTSLRETVHSREV